MRCFVCNEGGMGHWFRLASNGLESRKCPACGMVTVANSPISAENAADFYSLEAYLGKRDLQDTTLYQNYYASCFASYSEDDYSIRQFGRILSDIQQRLPGVRAPRLLDVGCATGVFLDMARKRGFEPTGVEVSPKLAEYARREFGLTVHSSLLEAGLPTDFFDSVSMMDVIEHIPPGQLVDMLAEIRRLLRPGGVLAIRTPGEDGLLRAMAKGVYFGSGRKVESLMHLFYSFEHILSFGPATLDMLLARHGFTSIDGRREEENPRRLNIPAPVRAVLRGFYLLSGILGREHKIIQYYR